MIFKKTKNYTHTHNMITRVSFCSSAGCFRRPGWIKVFKKKERNSSDQRYEGQRETLQAAFQNSSVRIFEVELFTLELNCKDTLLITSNCFEGSNVLVS